MATLTNQRRDRVTVDCGGFGGDNVFGTVEENAGGGNFLPVRNARVRVINLSTGDATDPAVMTNAQGKFDVDVNAADCHKIWIHVEWTDGNGSLHIVTGSFTCPCSEGESAGPRTIEERSALVARLQSGVLDISALLLEESAAIAVLHQEAELLLQTQLNAFSALKGDDERKRAIDQEIRQELGAIQTKFDFARAQGPVPSPDLQWRIIEELWNLLQKLIWKAFVIQEMTPPEFPPRPPGGGGDIT